MRKPTKSLRCIAAVLAAALAGCAVVSNNPTALDASGNPVKTLLANKSIQVTRAVSMSVENLVLGTTVYWLVDPLAPNWQLQQAALGGERVRIALRKKRFASGGDGEAAQLFARHAEQLAREGGYAGYSILEYTEGIESTLPLAERVAQGVIQLKTAQKAGLAQ